MSDTVFFIAYPSSSLPQPHNVAIKGCLTNKKGCYTKACSGPGPNLGMTILQALDTPATEQGHQDATTVASTPATEQGETTATTTGAPAIEHGAPPTVNLPVSVPNIASKGEAAIEQADSPEKATEDPIRNSLHD